MKGFYYEYNGVVIKAAKAAFLCPFKPLHYEMVSSFRLPEKNIDK